MQIERRSGIRSGARGQSLCNNIGSNVIIKCLGPRPKSVLRATDDGSEAAVAVQAAAVAAVSAVIIHPAATELYNALVSVAEQHRHKGCCDVCKSVTWNELVVQPLQQPKRCKCCVGTGFVLCSTCQGRGRQVRRATP